MLGLRESIFFEKKILSKPVKNSIITLSVLIRFVRAHSKNYVDLILPKFDTPLPSSGQLLTFYMIPTLCYVTKRELSADPLTIVVFGAEFPF